MTHPDTGSYSDYHKSEGTYAHGGPTHDMAVPKSRKGEHIDAHRHLATDGVTVHEGRAGVYCSECHTIPVDPRHMRVGGSLVAEGHNRKADKLVEAGLLDPQDAADGDFVDELYRAAKEAGKEEPKCTCEGLPGRVCKVHGDPTPGVPPEVSNAIRQGQWHTCEYENPAQCGWPGHRIGAIYTRTKTTETVDKAPLYDAVKPPHYARGPKLKLDIGSRITMGQSKFEYVVNCIDVMRHIRDPRLATAFKYLWRVAFGGKREPGETREQSEIDRRDLESAIWYLKDYLDNPVNDSNT